MLTSKRLILAGAVVFSVLLLGWTEGMTIFPREMVDDLGYKVKVERKPERIISLAPSNTEILFTIGAGDKVVGVTEYCDFPPQVKEIDKIGGYATPNIEAIVAKDPDLVVASYGNGEENIKRLRELGITVLTLYPKSLQNILKNIKLVGEATGYEEEATKLVEDLGRRIEVVKEEGNKIPEEKKPRVLYLVWYPELWTAGKGTFADDLIEMAGGKNIASDIQGWKIIGKEVVIDRDPEVIFCSGMGKNSVILMERVLQDADLKRVSALKNNRVYTISSDIVERPGPRIVDGLEKMRECLASFSGKE